MAEASPEPVFSISSVLSWASLGHEAQAMPAWKPVLGWRVHEGPRPSPRFNGSWCVIWGFFFLIKGREEKGAAPSLFLLARMGHSLEDEMFGAPAATL